MSVYRSPYDDVLTNIQTYDYPIQGKMIIASCQIGDLQLMTDDFKQHVRSNLIHQIADFILENKLVEFTQMKDPISFNTIVKARCYMTPDGNVRLIRSAYNLEK